MEESAVPEDNTPHETAKANVTSNEIWQLFFDGASRKGPKRKMVVGGGVVFISPQNHIIRRVYSLIELCSNNIALIIGLKITIMGEIFRGIWKFLVDC